MNEAVVMVFALAVLSIVSGAGGVGRRLRLLKGRSYKEKKMFGRLTFMLDGRMCCSILNDELMVMVLPERYEELLKRPSATKMYLAGKVMKGLLFVGGEGIVKDRSLKSCVDDALRFIREHPVKCSRWK